MTPRPLVIVGAGGFGREVLDVVEAINAAERAPRWRVLGVADDAPSPANLERLAAHGVPHLGSIARWLDESLNAALVLAVGSPASRRAIAHRVEASVHADYPVLIHPRAHVGSQARLGVGTVICGGVQISTNVHTGAHVHLNPNSTIGHDSILGDVVSVNPAAVVSGECRIGDGCLLGAGSVVLQGVTVGSRATVGAAACVVRDVSEATVVKGVPAR